MGTDNRHHTRAKVNWPVSINAPTGIVDGTTENLSVSGAFIRLSRQLSSSDEMPLVLKAKGRLIPCSVEVVWSDKSEVSDQKKSLGIGVHFTRMMLHDREFLHRDISNRT
jgi:hypothetical protein